MTFQDAMAYLETFADYERHPQAMREVKLERMRRLCGALGDPQRRFRSILVAGTNGKGSICAMLYAMLRESPLRVGLYTSPHLEHLRERIRVWTDGPQSGEWSHGEDWISEEEFVACLEAMQPAIETVRRESPEGPPTHFELVTALAFRYFQQRRVDVAVLEVGLGGRLDATNVVHQELSLIAPIDVDHAELLGRDPAAVAREKAGIIKPRQTVITCAQPEPILAVVREACEAHGASLLRCGEDVTVRIQRHSLDGLQLTITGVRGIYESVDVPLVGRHQAQNAAVAVAALELLSGTGAPHGLVAQGLAHVAWPGRLEAVHEAPLVLLDGAHNPHAAGALREALTELCAGRRIHLLIGTSSDKAVEGLGKVLGPLAVSATCTQSRHPRALDPVELARRLRPFCDDVHVMSDAVDAYTYLLNAVAATDAIVVTGSLFLVGALRAALRQAHVRPRRPSPLQTPA